MKFFCLGVITFGLNQFTTELHICFDSFNSPGLFEVDLFPDLEISRDLLFVYTSWVGAALVIRPAMVCKTFRESSHIWRGLFRDCDSFNQVSISRIARNSMLDRIR